MPSLCRRDFIKAAGAVGAATVGGAIMPGLNRPARAAAQAKRPPNLLIFMSDDQRADTIHALGNSTIQTPAFDRLVRGGMAFTRCRHQGSWSGAVCIPTRAMLHTGRTLYHVSFDMDDWPTLGQILQQAGYDCHGFGKWHNEPSSFARSFNGGGNIFFGGMDNQYKTHHQDFDPSGKYAKSRQRVSTKFSSELFADPAVEFVEKQKGDRPFFCYLAFTSPHDPRTPPPPFDTMYDPATMPLPGNFLPRHPFDHGEWNGRDEMLAPYPRTPENTRKQLCDYYGMVSSQDQQIGRVVSALEKSGQLENTIIISTGDHGLSIGSHGLFGKQNVYEESVGIPLLMSGPGIAKDARSDAMVYQLDVLPTLLEMLEIKAPASVEGRSFKAIFDGKQTTHRDTLFHSYDFGVGTALGRRNRKAATAQGKLRTHRAVTDGRWKFIRYFIKDKTIVQLFDLKNDPLEMNNLASDPAAAKPLADMQGLLARWHKDLDAPAA